MISLKLLAAELLFACPGCKEEHQDDLTSLTQDIYVPGEITEMPLSFRRAVRIYASPNNPGAREVADVLKKAMAGLELSTEPPQRTFCSTWRKTPSWERRERSWRRRCGPRCVPTGRL